MAVKNEIRIALLGNVSVGKTTVLNALFKDKFGEVNKNRCTAGVNYFRIKTKNKTPGGGLLNGHGTARTSIPAQTVHKTISQNNATLRGSSTVEEARFEVAVEPFITVDEKISPDLVVIDVPGLNESRSADMYKQWVREHFAELDFVILVMDVNQGVNTDQEVQLLSFMKTCMGVGKE